MEKSYASSVKIIPEYSILFNVIMTGIIFLISFSGYSLLIYINIVEFCIFYFITFMCILISSNIFFRLHTR